MGSFPLQPPHRTVRADFPHTAPRQSLATRHSQGAEGVHPLQVQKSIAVQSRILTLSLSKGTTTPLAPVQKKSLEPTSDKMVYVSKRLSGISVTKVVGPTSEDDVDFRDDLSKGLLISAPGPFPNLISQTRYGFLRGNDIKVSLVSSLQVPVIAKGKSQKVQRYSLLPHLYNVRLVPVHSKSKVCFQLPLYPSRDAGAYVSSQNQEVIGISDQSGLGRLVRPLRFLMKAFIHCMKIDIGQQGRDHPSLRGALIDLLSRSSLSLLYHRASKPHPNQLQHRSICNPSLYPPHQTIMRYRVKVARQIRVIHLPPTHVQIPSDLIHRALCSSPWAKPMRTVQEICLEDRFDHQQHRHLYYPVPDTGNPQRAPLAIGLGNVDPSHRSRSVGLGTQFSLDLFEKCLHPSLSFLDTADADSIHPRCSLVGSHPSPRCLQNISTKHSIIQRVEPKLTFSLSLATQFPSQKRDLLRHPRFRLEPFRLPFRYGALLAQAVSPLLDQNVTEVWPLGSVLFPGLPRYYGPLRLPTVAAFEVMDSLKSLVTPTSVTTPSGLPGSSTDLSARALPNHPGRPHRCLRSLLPCGYQASPSLEGWPPPSSCNEAESGLLSLGLTPSLSGKVFFPLPLLRDRPTPRLQLPCTGGRNYMLNEQLARMTLYSHIDQPGLSWRTGDHREYHNQGGSF